MENGENRGKLGKIGKNWEQLARLGCWEVTENPDFGSLVPLNLLILFGKIGMNQYETNANYGKKVREKKTKKHTE